MIGEARLEVASARANGWAQWRLAAFALALALGTLAYYTLVYAPSVAQSNLAHGYSGYGSDLYSRWYGAREFLLHGRDPYSAAITAEMQRGFVGRDPLPGEQLPEWSVFAQPLYTVFLLAPLILLDFGAAQALATIAFPLLIAFGGLLWLLALGAPRTTPNKVVAFLLALAAPATLYAANFQQLSALVFIFLTGAVFLVGRGRLAWAGLLLALSTIKPQESWLLIALLLVWALFNWRERKSIIVSFALSLAVLVLAALALMPSWIGEFISSLTRYSQQTASLQLFNLPAPLLITLAVGWLALMGWVGWRIRREPANSPALATAGAIALAVTVIMIPAYLQYERIFLLPALFALLWNGKKWLGVARLLVPGIVIPLLFAPWVLAAALGFLQLIGLPVINADGVIKALPWVPYVFLAYLAALALLPLLAKNAPASQQITE